MTLEEKVKYDLTQHPLDRNPAVLAETFERMKLLEKYLGDAVEELEGWWSDQDGYGTGGYEVWIPEMKEVLRGKV